MAPHARRQRRDPISPEKITSFQTALRYLNAHINLERARDIDDPESTFKLDRTRRLLDAVGNPQAHLRTVHVAGTKGKGSTVAMLSAALQGTGLTVGTYTSPHLVHIRERIQINDYDIPEDEFARLMQLVGFAVDTVNTADPPGIESPHFFELLTALAFMYFADRAVDIAIIEVGLGGRLDSTNVITPEISAITQISLDHTRILGDTLEAIAREKAGILKPGVPAYTTTQTEGVERVLRETAASVGTTLTVLDRDIELIQRVKSTLEHGAHMCIDIALPSTHLEQVVVPLPGEHQGMNCGLALAIISGLRERGFAIDFNKCVEGLDRTFIRGRMELISKDPAILIDGAHNATSVEALIHAIGAHVRCDSIVVIFGCSQDKDIPGMLQALARGADKVIFTKTSHNPWAADPKKLADEFAEIGGHMCQWTKSLHEALEIARQAVTYEDLITITGSFYLAGEARRLLMSERSSADTSDNGDPEVEVRRLSPMARLAQFRRR